jgi:tetratricopeptide (TPR) repeat protein
MKHFALPALVFSMLLAVSSPGRAQQTAPTPPQAAAAPAATIRLVQRLDKLFDKLKEAENAQAAKSVASDIERAFEHSGSATADLIYARVKEAMTAQDFDAALDLIDYLVAMRPGWAEPYHRRAIIHFIRKDQDAAFRDIRETLAREPRHYHALAGLGSILKMQGDAKGAFKAYRRVLEIYPHFSDLKESVEKMRPEVEGQPI